MSRLPLGSRNLEHIEAKYLQHVKERENFKKTLELKKSSLPSRYDSPEHQDTES